MQNHPHNALDNLIEGFQVISFDWRYLYLNDAVVKQSKYTREELLGRTMMEKYPGIENTPLFAILQKCMLQRVSEHFENEFTFPDGSRGWFDLRVHPIPEGIYILSVDITERKKAEEEKNKYVNGLEEMLFATSHKVRQPVVNILGISNLLDEGAHTSNDLKKIASYMKQCALKLDLFTKELNDSMYRLKLTVNPPRAPDLS